jgi:hypothetical protein
MSREEEAELALKNTKFAPGTRGLLIALFPGHHRDCSRDSVCLRIFRGAIRHPDCRHCSLSNPSLLFPVQPT